VWRSNWQGKWPCQIDREPWEYIHAGMCMHAEMVETRRRRGWQLSFVFVFLFSFFTTTCLIDRERSVGVCATRSNWGRKCRSVVCESWIGEKVVCVFKEADVRIFFFSFAKFLRVGWGALKQSVECGWKFREVFCWSCLKGEVFLER
jgi:hypothetical protein